MWMELYKPLQLTFCAQCNSLEIYAASVYWLYCPMVWSITFWLTIHMLKDLFNRSFTFAFMVKDCSPELIPVSVQFSSVAQSSPTFCNLMNCSTPDLPVHPQLPEFTQTHVHRVGDAIQPSHPLLSPSSPAPNPSQHQSLFQWVNSSHEAAKVLEFQL